MNTSLPTSSESAHHNTNNSARQRRRKFSDETVKGRYESTSNFDTGNDCEYYEEEFTEV